MRCDDQTVDDHQRQTLPAGRGFVDVERFALSTGLDQSTIRALIEAGHFHGLVDDQGHGVGIFDDTLPTADELRTLGLSVSHLYQPDDLCSYEDGGEVDPGDGPDSSWTMSW